MIKRDFAIDILKALAVLLIVNSHLDLCYPDSLSKLATGGAIGNALFFFCSGYTLFLGRVDGFVPWYRRRLARILPSFLVCSIVCSYVLDAGWWQVAGGYWFIRCILAHYVVLYLIRTYLSRRTGLVVGLLSVSVISCWFAFEDPAHDIYDTGYFMWVHYFACTLVGMYAASRREQSTRFAWWGIPAFLTLVGCYYVVRGFAIGHADRGWLQLLLVPVMAASSYCLYRASRSSFLSRIMEGRLGIIVRIVGGLCLEVYMMHFLFIKGILTDIFPLNIAVVVFASFAAAYAARCLSRFLVQTFDASRNGYSPLDIFGLD